MKRKFHAIVANTVQDLEAHINALAERHILLNVDAHCYNDLWYAFVLYEVIP